MIIVSKAARAVVENKGMNEVSGRAGEEEEEGGRRRAGRRRRKLASENTVVIENRIGREKKIAR